MSSEGRQVLKSQNFIKYKEIHGFSSIDDPFFLFPENYKKFSDETLWSLAFQFPDFTKKVHFVFFNELVAFTFCFCHHNYKSCTIDT